jgi:hypothetical protein
MADVVRPSKTFSPRRCPCPLRLKEIGLGVPHLVVAVTPDGQVGLRSNFSPDVLRGEEEARVRAG